MKKDNPYRALFALPVIVSALGFFVDVYDMLIFSIVRLPSLKSMGLSEEEVSKIGTYILNWQQAGLVIGGILWGVWGGVRDRQPEWVPEQRSHGEPVGHGADHRCLGAGVDKPPDAVLAQREDVDDRGEHQQRQRHEAHLAQPAPTLLVAARIRHDGHRRHADPFPCLT